MGGPTYGRLTLVSNMLIAGTARCVWGDLAAFNELDIPDVKIMAVNFIGTVWPLGHLDHWASIHQEEWMWRYWLQARLNGTNDVGTDIITPALRQVCDREKQGTSGLFAACVAFRYLGCTNGWLAGVPMDGSGHFYDPPGLTSDYDGDHYAVLWQEANRNLFKGRLKSMSGRTREWLGATLNERQDDESGVSRRLVERQYG